MAATIGSAGAPVGQGGGRPMKDPPSPAGGMAAEAPTSRSSPSPGAPGENGSTVRNGVAVSAETPPFPPGDPTAETGRERESETGQLKEQPSQSDERGVSGSNHLSEKEKERETQPVHKIAREDWMTKKRQMAFWIWNRRGSAGHSGGEGGGGFRGSPSQGGHQGQGGDLMRRALTGASPHGGDDAGGGGPGRETDRGALGTPGMAGANGRGLGRMDGQGGGGGNGFAGGGRPRGSVALYGFGAPGAGGGPDWGGQGLSGGAWEHGGALGVEERIQMTEKIEKGVVIWNNSWRKGLRYFHENGILDQDEPLQVAAFMLLQPGLDKRTIGTVLGGDGEKELSLLNAYVKLLDFKGLNIEEALRYMLSLFVIPGEGQKINRILERFSNAYVKDNAQLTQMTADQVEKVAIMLVTLNTANHNTQVKTKFTLEAFVQILKDEGLPLEQSKMEQFFHAVDKEPFKAAYRNSEKVYLRLAKDPEQIRRTMAGLVVDIDMELLKKGCVFTKFGRQGRPKPRLVFITVDDHDRPNRVLWCSVKGQKNRGGRGQKGIIARGDERGDDVPRGFPLTGLKRIVIGAQGTDVMRNHRERISDEVDQRCFSLVTDYRTLDLLAPEEMHPPLSMWMSFFHKVISENQAMEEKEIDPATVARRKKERQDQTKRDLRVWLTEILPQWDRHWNAGACLAGSTVDPDRVQEDSEPQGRGLSFLGFCRGGGAQRQGGGLMSRGGDRMAGGARRGRSESAERGRTPSLSYNENQRRVRFGMRQGNWLGEIALDRTKRYETAQSRKIVSLWARGLPDVLRSRLWAIAIGNEEKVSALTLAHLRAQAYHVRTLSHDDRRLQDSASLRMLKDSLSRLDYHTRHPPTVWVEPLFYLAVCVGKPIEEVGPHTSRRGAGRDETVHSFSQAPDGLQKAVTYLGEDDDGEYREGRSAGNSPVGRLQQPPPQFPALQGQEDAAAETTGGVPTGGDASPTADRDQPVAGDQDAEAEREGIRKPPNPSLPGRSWGPAAAAAGGGGGGTRRSVQTEVGGASGGGPPTAVDMGDEPRSSLVAPPASRPQPASTSPASSSHSAPVPPTAPGDRQTPVASMRGPHTEGGRMPTGPMERKVQSSSPVYRGDGRDSPRLTGLVSPSPPTAALNEDFANRPTLVPNVSGGPPFLSPRSPQPLASEPPPRGGSQPSPVHRTAPSAPPSCPGREAAVSPPASHRKQSPYPSLPSPTGRSHKETQEEADSSRRHLCTGAPERVGMSVNGERDGAAQGEEKSKDGTHQQQEGDAPVFTSPVGMEVLHGGLPTPSSLQLDFQVAAEAAAAGSTSAPTGRSQGVEGEQKGPLIREGVRDIVSAYICMRPEIGYAKGMSVLAAVLLYYQDVNLAFQSFVNLMHSFYFYELFTFDKSHMRIRFDFWEKIFREELPRLFTHFDGLGLTTDLFFVPWLSNLFCNALPLPVACRIWDRLFLFGEVVAYECALALLRYHENALMTSPFEVCIKLLYSPPKEDSFDDRRFMQCMEASSIPPERFGGWQATRRLAEAKAKLLEVVMMTPC